MLYSCMHRKLSFTVYIDLYVHVRQKCRVINLKICTCIFVIVNDIHSSLWYMLYLLTFLLTYLPIFFYILKCTCIKQTICYNSKFHLNFLSLSSLTTLDYYSLFNEGVPFKKKILKILPWHFTFVSELLLFFFKKLCIHTCVCVNEYDI